MVAEPITEPAKDTDKSSTIAHGETWNQKSQTAPTFKQWASVKQQLGILNHYRLRLTSYHQGNGKRTRKHQQIWSWIAGMDCIVQSQSFYMFIPTRSTGDSIPTHRCWMTRADSSVSDSMAFWTYWLVQCIWLHSLIYIGGNTWFDCFPFPWF